MNHLIVKCDKDLKAKDWTPFNNYDNNTKMDIIVKNDLINIVLDRLCVNGWELKNTFTNKGYIYFLLNN